MTNISRLHTNPTRESETNPQKIVHYSADETARVFDLMEYAQLYRHAIVENARLRARVAELEARLKEYEAQP